MNKIRTYTVTALLLICSFYGNVIKGRTQTYPFLRYPTQSLTIEDGMRQSVALDIAFDKYNFCWMSFMNGIQRYDGTRIIDIPVQSGLPTDVNIKFWVRENKDLYLLHSSGISHYNADKAIFNQVFKFEDTSVQHITLLHSNTDYLYIITDYTTIYIIDTKEFRVFSKKEIGQIKQVADTNPSFFPNAIWNYKYYTANDTNNYLLQIKDTNITKQKWGLQKAFSYFTHFINNHHIFYAISNTSSIDIHIYNIEKKKSTSKINLPVNGNIVGRYSTIRWDEKQLLIAGNRLFITTDDLDSIKYEVLTLDNYSPANNHSLQKMYVDNYGNLFIATITDGLRIIKKQNLPISYLGTQKPNANYTLSVLADIENNRILTGISNQGVIVYDTLYRQVHTSENMASLGSVNRIIKVKNGYLFFSNNSTSVYHYDQYLNQKTPVELPNHFTYFNTMLKDEKDTAIVATYFGLYIIDKNSCAVSFKPMTLNEYAACTFHNEKAVFALRDKINFTDLHSGLISKSLSIEDYNGIRCISISRFTNEIILGTNIGIVRLDTSGNVVNHFSRKTHLPDDCIYSIIEDEKGNLWCSSNRGIFKINKKGDVLLHLSETEGLQGKEFNSQVFAIDTKGKYYFGGTNGVSAFYPSAINPEICKTDLLITSIKVNNNPWVADKAYWLTDKIELPYSSNNLSFEIALIGDAPTSNMSFLYKIEGLDKEWQTSFQYNKLQFSLEPGKYNLQLALANNTPNEPSVLKTIEIIILPPFYRNWLFISLISLTGIAFVSFYIYYFQKRKYEQQLHKLEAEQKVRDEKSRISRDLHDSVGVYAHTVMYHTDLLAKEKSSNEKIINDIHFASKEMITSLRETVWAMKKDSYTAEECWLRIKNFAQSLKRHYTSIQFEIKGNTPGNWTGNHRQSLHVVRIIQEAVSNAIKHADSKELKIFSEYNMVFWTIRVSDSGKGFDIHTHKDSGNGLGNMLKRAEEAGYQLQIDTDIQNGCHIILKIPIHLD